MLATVEQAVATPPAEWDAQKLESLKKSDLQALLKDNDLKGSSKTKTEIVQILLEHYSSQTGDQGSELAEKPIVTSPADEIPPSTNGAGDEDSFAQSPTETDAAENDESTLSQPLAQSKGRGRSGRNKKVAEESDVKGSDDAMDVDGSAAGSGENESKIEASKVKSEQSSQPDDIPTNRPQNLKTITKRKSIYAPGETPIPKFLVRHNLSYLETVLRREELLNWQLLRMMTVSDFKAIGVSAGTALRFILAVKEEFPETNTTPSNASSVSITIAADDVKSLVDELEGKLGTLALTDESSKSQLPSNRPGAAKVLKRQPSRLLRPAETANESIKAYPTTLTKPQPKAPTNRT
ncbi:hypothetical protein HK097_001709, partial [Rhizophlyctis rosea]